MNNKQGFTILEMLISLTILMVVLGLTSQGILMVMKVQNTQEATAVAQAKLRRTTEVIEQMMRSSVLGGLSNGPYAADGDSISFASLNGAAAYQVAATSPGAIEVYANDLDLTYFPSSQAMLVDINGNALSFDVGSVIPKGPNRFSVTTNVCGSMPAFTKNMQLHAVELLGFNFDSRSKTMKVTKGLAQEVNLAFNITDFRVKYIYVRENGTSIMRDEPFMSNGVPQKVWQDSGQDVSLKRLQLTMTTIANTYSGNTVERTYSSIINIGDLAGDQALVNIKGIKKCI